VLTALGLTTGLVALLGIIGNQGWIDMTNCRWMFVGGFVLVLVAPLMIFLKPLRGFLCWLMIILCSCYIIYDIEMVQSGRFGIDNYVLAAMMVYADIIQLFLYVLEALARN
jgi:FtsH-binding integral membrane protein